jgi:hypothetical protein
MLYPTTGEVLGFHDRSTLCWMVDVAVPVTTSVVEEVEALLVNEIFAEAVPLACGANVMVKGTLCPAGMVRGRVMPLKPNSELLEAPEDMVTLEPVALSARFDFALYPLQWC